MSGTHVRGSLKRQYPRCGNSSFVRYLISGSPYRLQIVSFVAWAYTGVSAFVWVPEDCIDFTFVFAAPLEWVL